MKVLMLGWELPPHNSGGLGVACYHLCKALARSGIDIEFVLPYQADHNIDFILTNPNDATVNGVGFVLRGAPTFVDAANRDYHLRPYSPGLDVAPSVSNTRDLDGRLRDLDLPQINNVQGPRDLGAYELQSIPACSAPDQLFCNGFGVAGGG